MGGSIELQYMSQEVFHLYRIESVVSSRRVHFLS